MGDKVTNTVLRDLVTETGSSYEALLRRLNDAGGGLGLTYGRSALSQWIGGHVPPAQVRDLFAEVLTAKLGRTVLAGQIWPESLAEQALQPAGLRDSVLLLEALTRNDVDRRDVRFKTDYASTSIIAPVWRWLFASNTDQRLPARPGSRRVGASDVDQICINLCSFDVIDHRDGGGEARPIVAEYLHSDVVPMLHGRYSQPVGRDLFAGAALLARKAGLMSVDSGLDGLGLRYWTLGLDLAKVSGDRAVGAHILVSMSHHAVDLGCPELGAELATAAATGAGRSAPAALTAKTCIMQARASARRGAATACFRAIDHARVVTASTTTTGGPWWVSNVTSAYFDSQIAACHLDLRQFEQAAVHAAAGLHAHGSRHRRRQAMSGLLLAQAQVGLGEPDTACATAAAAIRLASDLHSTRTQRELHRLTVMLGPYRRRSAVRDLLDHLPESSA